ncbi:ferredoxin reductase [Arenimonas sp.]|uniref:ferredoxin reductase n=1 Tax=Arenimonas sp. TaxID=1872635 RepID=UPI002E37B426|nr:ferredoxin reductase [Arenimonas sp.]HEX4853394.1 ferredoxin reductase [Arenimonas sp.]
MRPDPVPGPAPTRSSGRGARSALVSPALLDFWAQRWAPAWSWNRPLARVVAREQAAADAVSLVLKPNRHFRGFRPGQHLNLGVEIDGRRVVRSYSPSAPAAPDGRFRITVKVIAGGKASRFLHDHAKVGDVFTLGEAFGDLALPADDGNPRLLLAAGSGITPMMAIFASLAAQANPAPTTLLYSTRTRDQRCFVDELRAITAAHPALQVRFLLTRDRAGAGDEAEGRLDADQLAPWLDARAHVLACGPTGFVDAARTLLANRAAHFAAESFSPPVFENTDAGTVELTLARSGRTLEVPRGQPLLDALEAAGLSPAHGCRRGLCNTCACGKSSGLTRHLLTGEVEHEPVSALRLCVSSARSDLVLDL